jgi:hypothetical protein
MGIPATVKTPARRRSRLATSVAAFAAAVAMAPAALAGLTVVEYPPALNRVDADVTVSWAEQIDARLHYGRVPGVYTGLTLSHGVGSVVFRPSSEGMAPGIYFAVVRPVHGGEDSGEFGFVVESPVFATPTAPPNGGVVGQTTARFEWDPVEGVPYYHVVVSDSDIEITEEDGRTTLTGANIVWQAITSSTAVQYGSVDPSGHFIASNGESPPLMAGFDYRWLILNNYGNHPLLTSLAGASLAGFTVSAEAAVAAPQPIEPADSLAIVGDVVRFSWTPVEGTVGYRVYLYQKRSWGGGEASYPVWDGPANAPAVEVHVGAFLSTGAYAWRVVALDQNGRGAASDLRWFDYSTETGTAAVSTAAAGGQPVPQVLVEIRRSPGGVCVLPAVTDDGGWALRELAPGAYEFHATKPGFRDTTVTATVTVGETTPVRVVMRRPSARLRGTVVDALGHPVFDATVVASGDGGVVEGMTDTGGRFAVQLEAGAWTVRAVKPGYADSPSQTVVLAAGEYAELPVALVVAGTPGSVTGNVVNPAGAPVAGATVRARCGETLCPTTTGVGGRFSIALAPGTWSVWAERTGFRPSDPRTVEVGPGASVAMDPAVCLVPVSSAIMGRVTDGRDAVAGARVVASPLEGPASEASTNSYGEFVLLPPPGAYALSASAEGFCSLEPFQVSTEDGGFFVGLELLVAPLSGAVTGRVLDGSVPVPGALVTAGASEATTDGEGAFSLALPPGLHAVAARKSGHAAGGPVWVAPHAGQTHEGLALSLTAGAGSAGGRVTHDGTPVPGARVTARSGEAAVEARAGADGVYCVPLESGEWTLAADALGFERSGCVVVTLAPGQSASGVDLALETEWPTLRGTTRDEEGDVPSAQVVVLDAAGRVLFRTASSSAGDFAVRVPPATDLVLEAVAPQHGARRLVVAPLDAGSSADVDVFLPAWAGSLTGKVVDDAGREVAGAVVTAAWSDSAATRSTAHGRYTLWLDDGLYDARVECPGHRPAFAADVEIAGGQVTQRDFVLEREFGVVEGAVTDSLAGAPLSGVLVTAVWGGGASDVTAADGRYRLERVVPGAADVRFVKPGCRKRAASVVVPPNATLNLDATLLVLSGTIGGRVLAGGEGLPNASVRAALDGSVAASALTTADGSYLLAGLDPDEVYDVHASMAAFYEASPNPLVGVPTATTDADFALLPADAVISGLVLDQTTLEGLAGATVEADDGLGHFGATTTGEDGSFAIANLPSGRPFGLSARLYGYHPVEVSGVDPDTLGLALRLPRNFARVLGVVSAADPDVAMEEIEIVATSAAFAGQHHVATPDPLGAYELADVRPGPYALSASGNGCLATPAQVWVDLEEGAVLAGVDFAVERASVQRIEVNGPAAVRAGTEVLFSGDGIADGGRLVSLDLAWSVSPASAGTIDGAGGRFACAADYVGEVTVRAAHPASGTVGRLTASAYAEVTPTTETDLRDSTGMLLRIGAGAVTETRSVFLSHEDIPDARRYGPDFEVVGPGYHLKPDGLPFVPGREPALTLPSERAGAGVAVWNRSFLRWDRLGGDETGAGIETVVATLGEYAVLASSDELSVRDIRAEPNPFSPDNGPVEISYDLSSDDARMPFVTVTVYNLAARTARRVVEHEPQGKGRRSVSWDGTTDDGDEARNGRYVVEVRAEDATGEVAACATLVLVK